MCTQLTAEALGTARGESSKYSTAHTRYLLLLLLWCARVKCALSIMGPATDKIPVLCYRLARSAVLLVLLAVNNAISSNEPSLQTRDKTERVRPYNRFVAFQGFHGGKVRIDVAQLLQDQADAAWAEDTPASTNTNNAKKSTTYSVIVVHWRYVRGQSWHSRGVQQNEYPEIIALQSNK